jgi:hypothetical protein
LGCYDTLDYLDFSLFAGPDKQLMASFKAPLLHLFCFHQSAKQTH